jgi:hypothetical protein
VVQRAEFGVCVHVPAAQASSVQATVSAHSEALQQLAQLAPPLLLQHFLSGVQSGTVWHCPLTHLPFMQGSELGHCESLQH